MEFYFFFTFFAELERETERDAEDREGVDRETFVRDVLRMDRDEEELLEDDMRLGE